MNEVLNSGGSVWGVGGSGGSLPSGNIKINSNQGGVNVTQGQTTLDKALNTVLSLAAIVRGRDYIPTTEQPQNNGGYYNANQGYTAEQIYALQNQNNNTGTGQQIENLIQNNKGLIIAAGVAFLLLQMKPLSRK